MASVELAKAAVEDLDRLIATLSLPRHTRERVRRSLEPLADFPLLGAEPTGQWQGFRFLLGAWRRMICVYVYLPDTDRVAIVTVQDAGSSSAVRQDVP